MTRALLTALVGLSLWQFETTFRPEPVTPPRVSAAPARPTVEKLLGCTDQGRREYEFACKHRAENEKITARK